MLQSREGHNGYRVLLRHGGELDCHLGDDAEAALGADDDSVEVVAGAAFARAATRLDDAAVGKDHGHIEDPVPHGAVPYGIGTGAVGADHSAKFGAGGYALVRGDGLVSYTKGHTWINGEKQTDVLAGELFVEVGPAEARLNGSIHILGTEAQTLVHVCEVDAYAAKGSACVAFDTAAATEGDDGHLAFVADTRYGLDLFSAARIRDCDWKDIDVDGGPFRVAVCLEVCWVRGDDALGIVEFVADLVEGLRK